MVEEKKQEENEVCPSCLSLRINWIMGWLQAKDAPEAFLATLDKVHLYIHQREKFVEDLGGKEFKEFKEKLCREC